MKRKFRRREEENGNNWNQNAHHQSSRNPVVVTALTAGQKNYIVQIESNIITICTGPAGTGKTAISVGLGLRHLLAPKPAYKKLIIMRPAKEACDEHVGFLPGSLDEKMSPWLTPVIDNMLIFLEQPMVNTLLREKLIEVIPLAYARGRSLNDAFIIVDEAQNCSLKQMKMVLTRIGRNSKMVVNGDTEQSDNGNGHPGGLEDAILRHEGISGLSIVKLEETDIVRHPMIVEILRRYRQELPASPQK